MAAFSEALYEANEEPLHLVLDEADLWAPQRPIKGWEGLLGHIEEVVRRGRVRGFIPWLITQRPAVVHKDVLSQADILIAMKLTASQDRDAIGASDNNIWPTERNYVIKLSWCKARYSSFLKRHGVAAKRIHLFPVGPLCVSQTTKRDRSAQ
jgi:hypothetical protein